MPHASLTSSPTPDDFRALARSSPWLFRTLHWSSIGVVPHVSDRPTEAWLQRPGRLTVRDGDGVELVEGAPYGPPVRLEWPGQARVVGTTTEPGVVPTAMAEPGLAPATGTDPRPRPASAPPPVLGPDGLVAERPEGYHLEHGDPMWQSYLWTAMLDPDELSHDVDLSDVHATERHGRPTWWATASARQGYDPRCGCCPLLLGQVSVELEYGPFDDDGDRRGWETRWDDLPTAYLVGLDVQTGIVVDVTPLDGSGGTRLSNEIHAVDTDLAPPPPTDGRRSR